MGQDEVWKILQKKRDWMCVLEISKRLNVSRETVRKALRQMLKYGEVAVIEKRIPLTRTRLQYWRIK